MNFLGLPFSKKRKNRYGERKRNKQKGILSSRGRNFSYAVRFRKGSRFSWLASLDLPYFKIGGTVLGCAAVCLFYTHGHDFVLEHMRYAGFEVKTISVAHNQVFSPEEVTRMSQLQYGTSIFSVDAAKARRLIEAHPNIRDVVVRIQYPSTIAISIEEREPVAVVVDRHYYYIDSEGVVLAVRGMKKKKFPRVVGIRVGKVVAGQRISATELEAVLAVLRYYKTTALRKCFVIDKIQVKKHGDVVLSNKYGSVIRLSVKNYKTALEKLRFVVDDLVKRKKKVKCIDMRYQSAVVKLVP